MLANVEAVWQEEWREEWQEKGRAEGITEGMTEGLKAQRAILQDILELRLSGPVPEDFATWLNAETDIPRLQRLASAALRASDKNEVLRLLAEERGKM